jgi:hypothetical protein
MMSAKPNKTADFLRAMQQSEAGEPPVPASAAEAPVSLRAVPTAATKPKPAKPPSRASLKHFGGYLEDDTLEKIALLRIRLKVDNSQLIKLAVDDLYRKHNAKRAFGDA